MLLFVPAERKVQSALAARCWGAWPCIAGFSSARLQAAHLVHELCTAAFEKRSPVRIYSVEKPDLVPFEMPNRFKTEIAYFMTPAGEEGVPELAPSEYWVRLEDARLWLEDGVVLVVSPLDAAAKAEVELSEEQEAWLEWMVANEIQHVRVG